MPIYFDALCISLFFARFKLWRPAPERCGVTPMRRETDSRRAQAIGAETDPLKIGFVGHR
jgi:hypothetical protein